MHKLAAIMFVDIVGYTALMGQSEKKALAAVKRLKEIITPLLSTHKGQWHKDLGDGVLSSFESTIDAANCAIGLQREVNIGEGFKVRIGIHIDDIQFEDGDILGDGVNLAQRIQSHAPTGGIALSSEAAKSIRNHEEIELVSAGRLRFKNVKGRKQVYYVSVPGVESIVKRKRKTPPIVLILVGLILGSALYSALDRYYLKNESDNFNYSQRFVIPFGNEQPLFLRGRLKGVAQRSFDISEDGTMIAGIVNSGGESYIATRDITSSEFARVAGSEGAFYPFISPDGKWICYYTPTKLMMTNASGMKPQAIMDISRPTGGVWFDEQTVIVSNNDGGDIIQITDIHGSKKIEELQTSHGALHWPARLSEKYLLFSTGFRIIAMDVNTLETKQVCRAGDSPQFISSGYLLYSYKGTLRAVRINPKTAEISGVHVTVSDDLRTEPVRRSSQYSVSENGTLIFASGDDAEKGYLYLVNPKGDEELVSLPADYYSNFSFSPDESFISYTIENKLYVFDRNRGTSSLVTDAAGLHTWSPDGSTVTYNYLGKGENYILDHQINSDQIDTLYRNYKGMVGPYDWSPDKRFLIYVEINPETLRDIMYFDLYDPQMEPKVFSRLPSHDMFAEFSPLGDYVVYETADASGTNQIFILPFPPNGQRIQVSNNGGQEPYWLEKTGEVVYHNFETMYKVDFEDENFPYQPLTPEELWSGAYQDVPGRSYSVTEDGRLFLMKKSMEENPFRDELVVITNLQNKLDEMFKD